MSPIIDIQSKQLAAAYLLLLFPLGLMLWFRVELLGRTLTAAIRMTVQLIFVGLYLKVIFELNLVWLNLAWLAAMVLVADLSVAGACDLRLRRIALPLFTALLAGTTVPLLIFTGLILQRPNLMDAQYAIPIAGMILGNCLRADIVGIRTFYDSIRSGEKPFLAALANGASLGEAVGPYLRKAFHASLAPSVATMTTMGLVSLPGMMTGTILAGASPVTAIKYQIAIMVAIFSGTAITVAMGIGLTIKTAFTTHGPLKAEIFKSARAA